MRVTFDESDLSALAELVRGIIREELAAALPSRREARPAEPLVVDFRGAAELLNCSARSVERLVADGTLPAVRLGSRVRIAVADLRRLIDAKKEPPAKAG